MTFRVVRQISFKPPASAGVLVPFPADPPRPPVLVVIDDLAIFFPVRASSRRKRTRHEDTERPATRFTSHFDEHPAVPRQTLFTLLERPVPAIARRR